MTSRQEERLRELEEFVLEVAEVEDDFVETCLYLVERARELTRHQKGKKKGERK